MQVVNVGAVQRTGDRQLLCELSQILGQLALQFSAGGSGDGILRSAADGHNAVVLCKVIGAVGLYQKGIHIEHHQAGQIRIAEERIVLTVQNDLLQLRAVVENAVVIGNLYQACAELNLLKTDAVPESSNANGLHRVGEFDALQAGVVAEAVAGNVGDD